MESQKRYIEIRIEMDGECVRVELSAHASARDLAQGYVTAAKNIAQSIANRSDATVSEILGAMAMDILSLGAEAYENEEED
mgnify:FL=1|jgi:hypothetical protein